MPLDHDDDVVSLLPVVSADPVPVLVPVVVDSDVPLLVDDPVDVDELLPLLSVELEDVPVEDDVESLPPTPALTLADPTPGTPPVTVPLAFQLSECPVVSELLVPLLVELPLDVPEVSVVEDDDPVDEPLVLDSELPEDVLSLWAELSVCEELPPLDELSLCEWLEVCDQVSEWLWLSV